MVREEYLAGRATLGQLEEAIHERAYLETMIALNVIPVAAATRAVSRTIGDGPGLPDSDAVIGALERLTVAARRSPSDIEFDTVEVPEIRWGQGIPRQGGPWEDYLEGELPRGTRLASDFPAFDFFDRQAGVAISAKTLDTNALTYSTRPEQIFSRLSRYVDNILEYPRPTVGDLRLEQVPPGDINTRALILAIPEDASPAQRIQIQRAIEYAEDNGVFMQVREVLQ